MVIREAEIRGLETILTYDGEGDFSFKLVSLGCEALGRTFKHLKKTVLTLRSMMLMLTILMLMLTIIALMLKLTLMSAKHDVESISLPIHDQLLRGLSAEEETM